MISPLESNTLMNQMHESPTRLPAGTIRISSVEHAAKTGIYRVLKKLAPDYPDITVEITLDYALVDIVAEVSMPGCDWENRWPRT